MTIEELTIITVKAPNKKTREQIHYWSAARHPYLLAAIGRCVETGEEQYVSSPKGMCLYHVRPEFPLIEEVMNREENKNVLKVSIAVYHPAFYLAARS